MTIHIGWFFWAVLSAGFAETANRASSNDASSLRMFVAFPSPPPGRG